MKMRLAMGFLFTVTVLSPIVLVTAPTSAQGGGDAEARKLFGETHKCDTCHGVAAAGIEARTKSEKMTGPDLSGYTPKKGVAEVASYVRRQTEIDGKSHTKEFKGTDEELQTILDWLGSLEAQK